MVSRLDDTHERSIALSEQRHGKKLLPLRAAAGYTKYYGYIGT
jgi:hypothetical protein